MAKYRVFVPEVHYQTVEIEATSPKDAVQMVLDGDGDYVDGSLEYSHQLGGQFTYSCFDVEAKQLIEVEFDYLD